jgi:16S rRNA (cytosine967-C5)-methyltransferase
VKNTRTTAARVLAPVLLGEYTLDEGLRRAAAKTEPRERALLRELCFGVCRHYQELDGLLVPLLSKPLKARDTDVRALLLIGLYQLRCMRVPDHAAVDQTVSACAPLHKTWARGLVNAVLRAYQSRTAELEAGLKRWQRVSHPAWLVDALTAAWPRDIEAILAANNVPGPLTLRVNATRGSRDAWLARAAAAGLDAQPGALAPDAVVLTRAVDVNEIPGFAEGEVSVQDEAAQLSARLLDPQPGERILDACAAPGGKTGHLLERCSNIDLLALDAQPQRLERVRDNLARLRLHATLREGDACEPQAWWDGKAFDAVLVDAPCSGTGVMRRHPDIKLLRRPAQIREASALQARILDALWPLLRPGGRMLYATCSVLPAENEDTIAAFVERTPGARVTPIELPCDTHLPHGLQLLPAIGGHDGFYYALLQKPPH